MPIPTFDPASHKVVLGAAVMRGFSDGSYITVEQDENTFELRAGADGEVARAKRAGRTATMTLRLLATSLSNAILTAYHAADAVFPVLVEDGANAILAAEGWIEKPAAYERGVEVADAEWTIRLVRPKWTLGGNPA